MIPSFGVAKKNDRKLKAQICSWIQKSTKRLKNYTNVLQMVTEVQCSEPDCVPIETLVILMKNSDGNNSSRAKWTDKILKPLIEVTETDVQDLDFPNDWDCITQDTIDSNEIPLAESNTGLKTPEIRQDMNISNSAANQGNDTDKQNSSAEQVTKVKMSNTTTAKMSNTKSAPLEKSNFDKYSYTHNTAAQQSPSSLQVVAMEDKTEVCYRLP